MANMDMAIDDGNGTIPTPTLPPSDATTHRRRVGVESDKLLLPRR